MSETDRTGKASGTHLLWRKQAAQAVDAELMSFMAGEDIVLDRHLFLYDVRASAVHAAGLEEIGVLSPEELSSVERSLEALAEAFQRGEFLLDDRFEDGHSAIEAWLTEQLGELGEKIHTGRSRNDQVLVASRLYLRDAMDEADEVCRALAATCLARAAPEMLTPMPGYTHLQRAVVSSLGLWLAGFAEAFIDDASLLQDTRRWLNANPLGTAAGYGVSLPLARHFTTERLGFDRLQINPIYAQNSRGRFELQALTALSQVLLNIRRLSWDLSLFTTAEFNFVTLPDSYTTGSSIMPNKRNPDPVELLRGAAAPVLGAITEMHSLLSLPSGYQRDLQNTKGPMVRAVAHALAAMRITRALMQDMVFDRERMAQAISDDMYATDRVYQLVATGMPFRQAYREVGQSKLHTDAPCDARSSLQSRCSPGGPGAPMLDTLENRLAGLGGAPQGAASATILP